MTDDRDPLDALLQVALAESGASALSAGSFSAALRERARILLDERVAGLEAERQQRGERLAALEKELAWRAEGYAKLEQELAWRAEGYAKLEQELAWRAETVAALEKERAWRAETAAALEKELAARAEAEAALEKERAWRAQAAAALEKQLADAQAEWRGSAEAHAALLAHHRQSLDYVADQVRAALSDLGARDVDAARGRLEALLRTLAEPPAGAGRS